MKRPLTVAVIPARGGSKRIPRKNIRDFHGRPLITWTIETLFVAKIFDNVVVSTDDEEIARIATSAGAEVPFRRPDSLSDDMTPTYAVASHAIDALERLTGSTVGDVCIAYPGAVFVSADDIVASYELLRHSASDVVMTAVAFPAPIERAWRINADGYASMIWPENRLKRSQDIPVSYHDAGQIYWLSSSAQRKFKLGEAVTTSIYELGRQNVEDIDTLDDWLIAERKFESIRLHRGK
jgi:N-acylneuraminate cytidylyltransferase